MAWKIAIRGTVLGVKSLEAASANGRTTLTLTFHRDLAAVASAGAVGPAHRVHRQWPVACDGRRHINLVPSLIETDGPRLRLIYNDMEALPGRELSVRYRGAHATRHLPTQLQYASGEKVAGFTATATHPAMGPVAPALTEAQVAGNVLTLTFDRALDASSAPAGRRFKVNHIQQDWDGPSSVVAGTGTATISGSTVTVTLAEPVPQDRFATVTYRKGDDANPLQAESSGPEVGDISWSLAAVLDRDAPRQTGALLAGTSLVLYYDEKLDTGSTPATSSYAVATAGNNPQGVTVSSVSIHPHAVELTLGSAPAGDVTVSYITPEPNPVQDAAGNDAANLTGIRVTRQGTDPGAPDFDSASVAAVALTASFTQSLDPAHVPDASAFTLSLSRADLAAAGHTAPTVTGVAVLGSDVELTMSPWWHPCDGPLTVAYAKPTAAADRLQNNWGSEVDAFTRTATNSGTNKCVFMAVEAFVQGGGQPGERTGMSLGGGPQGASGDSGRTTRRSRALGDASQQPAHDASENGTRIVLQFGRALDPSTVPGEETFTVTTRTTGAAPVEVTGVEMPDGADDRLLLSLSRDLAAGEQITVSYRRPHGASGLWDAQGNQVADFSVDVTAPGRNRPPVFGGVAQKLDNALPGFLVSLPMRQSDFSDPDGDPLTFSLSASRDDIYARDGDLPGGFTYNDRVERVFFLAKTACALASLEPPTGDAYYTVITMTATDSDGATAHATATFRTDPATFPCPSLSSAMVDGATLTMVFDANLAPSYVEPTAHEFKVKADGIAVSVADVSVADGDAGSDSGNTISLTLATPVTAGQTVSRELRAGRLPGRGRLRRPARDERYPGGPERLRARPGAD